MSSADQVGEATARAAATARQLRAYLLLASGRTAEPAERLELLRLASAAWPQLRDQVADLERLAPNAAAAGRDQVLKLRDVLELKGVAPRVPTGWDAVARAALNADTLAASLAEANEPGIGRAARVAHLVHAFKAWTGFCSAWGNGWSLEPPAAARAA